MFNIPNYTTNWFLLKALIALEMVNWLLCQPSPLQMLCMAFGKLTGSDVCNSHWDCPVQPHLGELAGWGVGLDDIPSNPYHSVMESCIFGRKRQGMVKILGGPADGDPREVLCALCCLSESALFTITCQELDADGSVPRPDSVPGKHRSLPAGFHKAFFGMWCFKLQMLEACDIPGSSAFVL